MPISRLSSITRVSSVSRAHALALWGNWSSNVSYTPFTWLSTSKESVRTPNYRTLRLYGILPSNNFAYRVQTIEDHHLSRAVSTATFIEVLNCSHWLGANYPQLVNSSSDPDSVYLRNRCTAKMLEEASGGRWNVPVFAAEVGKTASMVAQRAEDLVMLMRALRRGDFVWFLAHLRGATISESKAGKARKKFEKAYGKDAAKAASSAWLEFNYGWKPFVKDVYDAMEALFDLADTDSSRVGSVKASAKMEKYVYTQLGPSSDGLGAGGFYYRYRDKISRSVRTTWRFKLKPGSLPTRFSLQDPMSVLWELVPLSFVADWFIPVGQYLSCLNSAMMFDTISTSTGYRLEVNRDYSIGGGPSNGYIYSFKPGRSYQLDVQRLASTSTPSWTASGLWNFNNVRFAATQAATSISLLLQHATRMKR